ncbi:hypothetical protein AMS68_006268 [Peltaster fructicola]|uniref:Elongation factor 2 n=1 Tax=Peltaster fructicola TaxID=286661 RepID=A0A6H0Y1F4_9PEZI|nr:hypothetical protein AMS68_006268 [Peltaster fructicola]
MSSLVASPLGPPEGFNYVYLIELLICGILSLFFLFYFNRLFATVISYGIRAYTWHKYRAHIDITALQVSLLGGRIFFKSIRYHAHNITVFVHDGHITWRYWLRQVQEAEIFSVTPPRSHEGLKSSDGKDPSGPGTIGGSSSHDGSPDEVEAGVQQKKELPCRISVKVSGVEAFIYNRSPLYDGIVEATLKKAEQQTAERDSTSEDTKHQHAEKTDSGFHKEQLHQTQTSSTTTPTCDLPDVPQWLRVLPVHIQCKRAAAAIGNENTTSVLTAKVEHSAGQIDASAASSLDLYKLLFKFEFKKVTVAMKPNRDYKRPQANTAYMALHKSKDDKEAPRFAWFSWAWVPRLVPRFIHKTKPKGSIRTASIGSDVGHSFENLPDSVPGQAQWHGLTRYLTDESPDDRAEWRNVEYAKASTLADCEQVNMRFYWDIPGNVPDGLTESASLLDSDSGLNSPPSLPDYGIDLAVHGGFVTYGPWADRERVNLQRVFFPASFVDALPFEPPGPGQTRVATIFKLFLSIEEDVTLRIPTRETSKDHRWHGRANRGTHGPQKGKSEHRNAKSSKNKKSSKTKTNTGAANADTRPYGWLDVTVKPNSTVNYNMDMYARRTGFRNIIDLDIKGTEITSSVNHALLWRAGELTLTGDLSNPLTWNTLRDWPFKIVCYDMELFILRDHLFLIIDLVDDWGSGAPPDFYTFVPFRYTMDITFRNFVMYLNTNDANIINDPADFDTNDFLTLEGEHLNGVLGIPLEYYRPKKNEISFDVHARNLSMRMLSSSRSTIRSLLQENRVARLPELTLLGTFESNQQQVRGLTDTLRMDIEGKGFSIQAYGFLLRHLINIKENYFGDFVHFKTLEEFQNAGDNIVEANEQLASLPKPTPINELDVLLSIVVKDATIMLPTNLYSAREFVKAEVPEALVDLRVSSYYLDLAINISPVSIQLAAVDARPSSPVASSSNTQLYVSRTAVVGHRAFGLPPEEAPYVSIWEIDIGSITGEMKQRFLHDVVLAAKALIFTFADRENALPLDSPLAVFDASFVQVRTDTLRIWLNLGDEAMLLSADPINVHSRDWADETFSQHVNVIVPNLTVACVDSTSAARHQRGHHKQVVSTYAFFQTSLALNVVMRKKSFATEARKQQRFIRHNDSRTNRVPFLQRAGLFWQDSDSKEDDPATEPPAMAYPPFPAPLDRHGQGLHTAASVKSVRIRSQLARQKSTSSLASSIRNARLMSPQQSQAAAAETQHSVRSKPPTSVRQPATPSRGTSTSQTGLQSGTMAFSSIYNEPYFLLDAIMPDETVAPPYVLNDETTTSGSGASSLLLADEVTVEDDIAQTTIMIDLYPGIRAYADPRVAKAAVRLAESIQAKSAEDVMDGFQVDVMTDVADRNQRKSVEANVTQIGIHLPSLVTRLSCQADAAQTAMSAELILDALTTNVRLRSATERLDDGAVSLHVLLNSLKTTLRKGDSNDDEGIAMQLVLEDMMLWLALAKSRNIRLTMADISLSVMTSAAGFFSTLPQTLLPLIVQLQQDLSGWQNDTKQRLQLLLYQLTRLGEHVGDPPFLTKMTYILRAFPDHFRNQESWKVIMRFRNILRSLPSTVLGDLENTFQSKDVSCPEDAPQKMLESWTQWRNWDVVNIEHTEAFKHILEQPDLETDRAPAPTPLCLTWVQENIQVVIKSPYQDSHIVIREMTLGVDVEPPRLPTGLMLVEENKRTKILSHIHASSVGIELQWNLIAVVQEILPGVLKSLPQPEQVARKNTTQALEDEIIRQEFHLVVSTDAGSVGLHTLNLQHIAQAEGLRLSLLGTTQAEEPYGVCASALLNANRAGTQLHANSSMIWQSLLISPTIYIDHLRPRRKADIPPTVNVAVAYEEVQLSVIEQIPGILRIVDSVIAEEVAQIMQLIQTIESQQVTKGTALEVLQKSLSGENDKPAKINGALLAGELTVEISLLQSLKYRLTGTAASVRVAPSLLEAENISVDFETGTLHHSFINVSHGEEHQQRIVNVPPINGHVVVRNAGPHKKVSVLTTVGRLDIDAEALQSVATTLNRSEVQSVITAIKDGIVDIQERVTSVVPSKSTDQVFESSNAVQPLHYEVRVSLAGVRIAASAPQATSRAIAAFELGIGACNAVASNHKSLELGVAPWFPEVRGMLRDIGARLTVKNRKNVYPAGNVTLALAVNLVIHKQNDGQTLRELAVRSQKFEVNAYPNTAAIIVDVINQLQDRLKDLDLSGEIEYIRTLRNRKGTQGTIMPDINTEVPPTPGLTAAELLNMKVKVELSGVVVSWIVHADSVTHPDASVEDLVLTLAAIELRTQGVREGRLTIRDLQLQLVERGQSKTERTFNSALMPEIVFTLAYWSEHKDRHLAFKATGKPFDLRLDSRFVVPLNGVKRSIDYAVDKFRAGTASWKNVPTSSGLPRQSLLGSNHFASLKAEADFAGANFYLRGTAETDSVSSPGGPSQGTQHGRYGQFASDDGVLQTTLRSPGISFKLQYESKHKSSIQAEMMVAPSSNMLLPNVVPLVLQISRTVKEVMQSQENNDAMKESTASTRLTQSTMFDEALATADPTAIFGKTKINLGLRIARQEFGLTCQPIAKIDAKAELDDFYLTVSTIEDTELGHFFTASASLSKLSAKVKHVYSREPTFSFDMDSVILSLMNSKHFSGVNGISAILKLQPTRTSINGKQLQDLLLFREIWLPPEIRNAATTSPHSPEQADVLMHRYQIAANAAAFPWNAAVSISELTIDLDLGQSLGKSSFSITNLWASSQKTSNSEQNLCIGLDEVAMNSHGRMSGFINLSKLAIRTLIRWPEQETSLNKTPRIQASIGFGRMRAKAAFDYQAFAFGDIEGFDFMMYNVSERNKLSLYQAADRLIHEKQAAFSQSLKDIEKHMRRQSVVLQPQAKSPIPATPHLKSSEDLAPVTLHTDVVVSLGNICVGAFPGTFFDSQIFKVEANNLQARFAVGLERHKIRSGLGMTIGQLQVALAAVKKTPMPKNISDLGVDEVVAGAVESRGGVILKVPRVIASMETWQTPKTTQIEYIFKSLFEGKVDIGWNLSRINLIRGMWSTHSRALASRMGKPLPEPAVKITADLQEKKPGSDSPSSAQSKITAEVNLPQSRYEYIALEPPVIETPQLRDMGEATPPLEWIGLNRDRLPNITHQIIIVALLEVAKEVEDAYGRILGTS